jgi:hypothetical protein
MKKPTIHLINGIGGAWGNRDSRPQTTGLMAERFRSMGLPVNEIKYNPISARDANKSYVVNQIANQIVDETEDDDWIIGHSAGSLMIHEACRRQWPADKYRVFHTIILFAPAMEMNAKWDDRAFQRMYVITNPADIANTLGALIPGHRFGRAGKFGFNISFEQSDKIHMIPCTDVKGRWNHNNMFRSQLDKWCPAIIENYNDSYPNG